MTSPPPHQSSSSPSPPPPPPQTSPLLPFLLGLTTGALATLYLILTLLIPGGHKWGDKGCGLPFRAWDVKLSRLDVVVEIVAHSTHIHLPFLLYLLTSSPPLTLLSVYLFETLEWTNNALSLQPQLHTYDDPLDDVIQGVVGIMWAMGYARARGWGPMLGEIKGEEQDKLRGIRREGRDGMGDVFTNTTCGTRTARMV